VGAACFDPVPVRRLVGGADLVGGQVALPVAEGGLEGAGAVRDQGGGAGVSSGADDFDVDLDAGAGRGDLPLSVGFFNVSVVEAGLFKVKVASATVTLVLALSATSPDLPARPALKVISPMPGTGWL
jgi:hypothetical protein